ncbi:hypothetical protein [Bradyrhizobium lupini]
MEATPVSFENDLSTPRKAASFGLNSDATLPSRWLSTKIVSAR